MLLPGNLMGERVDVLAATAAKDGEGGVTETWATTVTLRCATAARASRMSLNEDVRAGLPRDVELLQFYINDPTQDVVGASRLEHNGITYTVVQIDRQGPLAQVMAARVA